MAILLKLWAMAKARKKWWLFLFVLALVVFEAALALVWNTETET